MKSAAFILLISSLLLNSQTFNSGLPGHFPAYKNVNGNPEMQMITLNEPEGVYYSPSNVNYDHTVANSIVRWSFTDAIAIGDQSVTSQNGLYQATGWGLNTQRVSLYGNSSNTPFWEFFTAPNTFINYTAISDTGGYIASGSYHNIYIFNRSSSTPIFNFNLETALADTGIAGPLDITGNGGFIIASANRNDSSWVLGFDRNSNNWVWRVRVGQTNAGGAGIQGIRISGNDSLAIVNTYGGFYVLRTYTGQLVYQGLINPISNSGTQFPQGISGNGSVIAIINYSGNLRALQWNGSTYNQLWQHTEPSAWMSAVDVTYDGTKISCGTLNFLGGSNYDGKIKLFSTAGGSTPTWTYSGCGDEVPAVSFSRDGKILAAASWGDINNANNDLLIFKTSVPAAAPIFVVNSPGSFFACNTSANGSTVIASGKRVHARTFGNGGEVYNIFIDTSDSPLSTGNSNNTPLDYRIYQNYPNPFNPVTQITYEVPENVYVNIILYDVLGRKVRDLVDKLHNSGKYSVILDANDLSGGVYFYRITAGKFSDARKLILVK